MDAQEEYGIVQQTRLKIRAMDALIRANNRPLLDQVTQIITWWGREDQKWFIVPCGVVGEQWDAVVSAINENINCDGLPEFSYASTADVLYG